MPDAATQRQTVAFDAIRLKVGDRLHMQATGTVDKTHYAVRYLGALKDTSLLTTIPIVDYEGMWMRPNGEYIFRVLAGSHVYAFTARVIKARAHPYPYAHFTYPDTVQARQVRHSPRIELHLASQAAKADGSVLPLTYLDISLDGALVEASGPLGQAGESVRVALPIHLSDGNRKLGLNTTIHSASEGERPRPGRHVALPIHLSEVNRKLGLNATIRSVSEGERPRYGLEFNALAGDEAMLLHFFIDHLVAEAVVGP